VFTTILPLCRSSKKYLLVLRVLFVEQKESTKKQTTNTATKWPNKKAKMSLGPNGKKTEKSVRSGAVLVFFETGPVFSERSFFGPWRTTQNGLFLVLFVLFWYFFAEFTPATGTSKDR
jgi:hypothetical protein